MTVEKFTGSFEKEDLGCTIIVNQTIRSISDPAVLGLYCYLLTKPSTWEINPKELMRHFKMSKDKAYRLLNALMNLNLLSRRTFRDGGRYAKFQYLLHLKPYIRDATIEDSPFPEKPEAVNQDAYKESKLPLEIIETTTSESIDSPAAAIKAKAKPNLALMQLIDIYREVFPDNPQPHPKVISTSLQKTLSTLVKRWPELDPEGNPITLQAFRRYMESLRLSAPKFSLGTYTTESGNQKKNGLETFARWNTIVKFLEDQYS